MIFAVLVVLGLCFGSFVNALVWRVHQQNLPRKQRAGTDAELSIAKGRSMCPHCKHTLAWYDLLPVISWVSLGGKCRYCKKRIGVQYPLVELATAGLFIALYVFWPYELSTINHQLSFSLWLAAIVGFMALTVYDLRWMLLPNRIVLPVAILAALEASIRIAAAEISLFGLVGSVVIASGLFYVLFQVSDGKWIGGGDVKLGLALGLVLGTPALAFMMLFFASIIGLIMSAVEFIGRKGKSSRVIPFGPCLILATIIVKLFGTGILDWYASHYLYF